jgi:hypothetical protein
MKPLPEPYASAPTPRTNVKIVKFTAISNRQGLARREYEGSEIDYVSPESMRQLERENLWLREVLEKLAIELQDCDSALDPTYKVQHIANKEAISAYNQLQEYLKERK